MHGQIRPEEGRRRVTADRGGSLERRIVRPEELAPLVPAWEALAQRAAQSPFETPAWLLPWLRHYGGSWQAHVLTWWQDSELVALAPVAWRSQTVRRITVRDLAFWGATGTPLAGWVGLLADGTVADDVAADFSSWLKDEAPDWDVFHYLHQPAHSPTLARLVRRPRPWARVDLARVLHSVEYVVRLADDTGGWGGYFGPKARREIRREIRVFERGGGRIEQVVDPGQAGAVIDALRQLMTARWGAREAYFRRDRAFAGFAVDVVESALKSSTGWVLVARQGDAIVACLVLLAVQRKAAALLIGVTTDPTFASFSLGKCLFHRAMDDAVARGCLTFSFLAEDRGYKTTFWRAERWPTESGILARGLVGRAVGAYVTARRVLPGRVRGALARRSARHRS